MIIRYTLMWIPLVFLAILNGVVRELWYKQYLEELAAHQVSTLSGILIFGLFVLILSFRWRIESAGQAGTVGAIWLLLTLSFEFLFGHYVMGHPWNRLLHDYNIFAGRVWSLLLIWITVLPFIIFKLRTRP
ncbi:hypothetical protein ACFL5L_04425 [candidate division KSB1 bacterium]